MSGAAALIPPAGSGPGRSQQTAGRRPSSCAATS